MIKARNLFLGLLSICSCVGLIISGRASAESQSVTTMKVSPVIEELSIEPSAKINKNILVTNQSDDVLRVRVYVAPYSVSSGGNASDFESQSEYTQIYHWIKIKDDSSKYLDEAEFSINKNSTKEISYLIDTPESVPGGSQHACLFVETIPDDSESSGITTVSRAAIKIFAEVSGETVKDAEIINLDTNTIVIDGKVTASAAVKNIGNVDINPTLSLKIETLSGETVFEDAKVAMVFPENDTNVKVEWPETPMIGVYNLTTVINILGKQSMIKKTIFIIPSWVIVIFLVLIATIVAFVIRSKKCAK